jgi:hypothetical protein
MCIVMGCCRPLEYAMLACRAQTQIDIIYCIIPFSSDMTMDHSFVCQYVKTSVQIEGVKKDPESFMSTHPSLNDDAHHVCCIT